LTSAFCLVQTAYAHREQPLARSLQRIALIGVPPT